MFGYLVMYWLFKAVVSLKLGDTAESHLIIY